MTDDDILEQLDLLTPTPFTGTVWRHMFADFHPATVNVRGARWNPAGTQAIYTSTTREAAVAEGNHAVAMQPFRPRAARWVYNVELRLSRMLDLTDRTTLAGVGVDDAALHDADFTACQRVGSAVAWLGHDGLLVPSVRSAGSNLVIYVANHGIDATFTVLGREPVT